jgi:hypothetical protein
MWWPLRCARSDTTPQGNKRTTLTLGLNPQLMLMAVCNVFASGIRGNEARPEKAKRRDVPLTPPLRPAGCHVVFNQLR